MLHWSQEIFKQVVCPYKCNWDSGLRVVLPVNQYWAEWCSCATIYEGVHIYIGMQVAVNKDS